MEGLNATVPDSVRAQAVAEVFELYVLDSLLLVLTND